MQHTDHVIGARVELQDPVPSLGRLVLGELLSFHVKSQGPWTLTNAVTGGIYATDT